jgi:hypothetical protein
MKKSELIKLLEALPGDPEIVVNRGVCSDTKRNVVTSRIGISRDPIPLEETHYNPEDFFLSTTDRGISGYLLTYKLRQ